MEQNKLSKALVMGAGGFIGSHMVKRLRSEGYWVRGVDLKYTESFQSLLIKQLLTATSLSFSCIPKKAGDTSMSYEKPKCLLGCLHVHLLYGLTPPALFGHN